MKIQVENIADLIDELEPLIKKHWEQIALNKDKIKLNPDWDQYKAVSEAGMLRLYTVRDENELLVGYFCVLYMRSLHYADHVFAACDVIYIRPDMRKGSIGYKLIKYVEKDLAKLGISNLAINTKVHAPFDSLLSKMGYNLTERLYTKYLGS